jgi:DNA-binding SARP family transcriptional activator
VEIGLLGEFALIGPSGPHKLSPRCRSVLAALALHARHAVSMERLVSWVWNADELPRRPDSALQTYVSRIRSCFGREADRLHTLADGYLLELDVSAVDALHFEAGITAALAGPGAVDVQSISDALALWRGPTLADVPVTEAITVERRRFDELRLRAIEARNEEMLKVGSAGDIIGDLQTLVYENPYHERFICQLLTAMTQLSRRADALATYQGIYRKFRDELGMEPGEEIRTLHRALLADGAPRCAKAHPDGETRPQSPDRAGPAGLSPSMLAGVRNQEVESIRPPRLRPALGLTPVTVIAGEPGAGATTVALRYSTRHRGQFPGGIHFVDAASAAVTAPWQLPARSDGAGRRPRPRLVILDGVASADQVRPWLVAEADHLIVTTTRRLAGLPQLNAVYLDPLSSADAVTALRATLGPRTFGSMGGTLRRIVSACEGNLLALTIVAASMTDNSLDHARQLVRSLDSGSGPFVASLLYGELSVFQSFRRAISACGNNELRLLKMIAGMDPGVSMTAGQVADRSHLEPLLASEALRQLADRHLVRVTRISKGEPYFAVSTLCLGALALIENSKARDPDVSMPTVDRKLIEGEAF